jgi:hypothetical protein
MPAAGLPWFVAPFGRDSLIVSLQNILIYPHFARGALDFLGSLQATEDVRSRSHQPDFLRARCTLPLVPVDARFRRHAGNEVIAAVTASSSRRR